ncbi:MAG: PPOX class probable F420-dependent enzyme [Acidimicrobiales bacterium]|jgi:PPOX class probable F420-dependent enzyme
MPKLSHDERATFLDEPGHLLRLATVDDDGMPRLSPVWFLHDEGRILFTPRAQSVFRENLNRDPRIALAVDETALPYRKVTVQGRAELLHDLGEDDVWRDTYRAIATRYISGEAAESYIQNTIDQPRALFGVDLAEANTQSWRMPVEGEQATGIWARRYYGEGTKMAERARE